MFFEKFRKKTGKGPESLPEPIPERDDDRFPNSTSEEIESLPPDTVPEEELLNEEENKKQEDEVEEGVREKPKEESVN